MFQYWPRQCSLWHQSWFWWTSPARNKTRQEIYVKKTWLSLLKLHRLIKKAYDVSVNCAICVYVCLCVHMSYVPLPSSIVAFLNTTLWTLADDRHTVENKMSILGKGRLTSQKESQVCLWFPDSVHVRVCVNMWPICLLVLIASHLKQLVIHEDWTPWWLILGTWLT